jgi:hypothetical protein
MKKLALFMVLAVAAGAQAETVLYSTGFESGDGYTTGNLHGQVGWSTRDFGGTVDTSHINVSTGDAYSGSQSLQWDHTGSPFAGWLAARKLFNSTHTAGVQTVQWWMRLEDSGGTSLDDTQNLVTRLGNITDESDTGWGHEYFNVPTMSAAEATTYAKHYYKFRVEGTNSSSGTQYIPKTGITDDDEWKGIRIVTDLSANTIDLYGRSESESSWSLMVSGLGRDYPGEAISSIGLYTASAYSDTLGYGGTKDVYVDDILVTWVPEPATVGLFAAGGLAMLLRRRRQ